MEKLFRHSKYQITRAKVFLAMAVTLSAAAVPAIGQEVVDGKFALTESAKLGNTVLPAGNYKFSVVPIGIVKSLDSLPAVGSSVLVVVRPESRPGPAVVVFARASREDRSPEPSELILLPEKEEKQLHAMHLNREGLLLDFDFKNARQSRAVVAQEVTHASAASAVSARSTD